MFIPPRQIARPRTRASDLLTGIRSEGPKRGENSKKGAREGPEMIAAMVYINRLSLSASGGATVSLPSSGNVFNLLLTGSTGNVYGSLNAARMARRLERSWDGRYRLPWLASVCP